VTPERLTDRSVAAIIKKRAEAAGCDAAVFSGHSLRAGFVTSALHHGADIFIAELLKDGPRLAKELKARLEELGISPQSVKTAKEALDVRSRKVKSAFAGGWG
jgi:hypothetical protein